MKKYIIVIAAICLPVIKGNSQTGFLPSEGYIGDSVYLVHWTLGEPFSGYTSDGQYIMTAGSSMIGMIITAIENPGEDFPLEVFPNPTYEYVFIRIEGMDYRDLKFELYSLEGRLIQKKDIESNLYRVDFKGIPGGTYILKLYRDRNNAGSYKIIKLN